MVTLDAAMIDGLPADALPVDTAPPMDAFIGQEMLVPMTRDIASGADIYVRTSLAPDENTNDRDFLIADGDNIASVLVRFDLSAIPTTAVVSSVEVRLYVDGDTGAPVTIHEILESWDEATATSNQRRPGEPWQGAGVSPPSRGTATIGNMSPGTADVFATAGLDVGVVQGWIAMPATNHGLIVRTTNNDGPRFAARERGAASQRPTLHVEYSN